VSLDDEKSPSVRILPDRRGEEKRGEERRGEERRGEERSQTFASWNHVDGWLRQVEELRRSA
jgi:hypothetical protein